MTQTPYRYEAGTDGCTDGCDDTFDVYGPAGLVASVPYWEDRTEAEAAARLIADALNAQAG